MPARAGRDARGRRRRAAPGVPGGWANRGVFVGGTGGRPGDEDEWWSCHLDCEPEMDADVAGLRWHCRDSYVLAPPSRDGQALQAHWLRPPDDRPLLDGLRLLGFLADACEETA